MGDGTVRGLWTVYYLDVDMYIELLLLFVWFYKSLYIILLPDFSTHHRVFGEELNRKEHNNIINKTISQFVFYYTDSSSKITETPFSRHTYHANINLNPSTKRLPPNFFQSPRCTSPYLPPSSSNQCTLLNQVPPQFSKRQNS